MAVRPAARLSGTLSAADAFALTRAALAGLARPGGGPADEVSIVGYEVPVRGVLWLLLFTLAGCEWIPRDAAGALQRVSGGELRVGVSDHPPWVVLKDGQVRGIEPELIEQWARRLDAQVVWRRGAPAELVEALHRRELDVLAAGLDTTTPHKPHLALSRPYAETIDARGKRRQRVLAVTQGESALLLALDRYLIEQYEAARRGTARSP